MQNVLENLYWLLRMVLRLSTIHNIFISPRDPSEYSCFKLKDYLNYISKIEIATEKSELWNSALSVLTQLKCWGSNNRSLYFRELEGLSTDKAIDKTVYNMQKLLSALAPTTPMK